MIEIKERLQPFSHLPGIQCLIPTTSFIVEAFPALLKIWDFQGNLVKEMPLDIQGPLKEFTLLQDLEKGCVSLFSEQYRFHILPNLEIVSGKNPKTSAPLSIERLSLGMHKKQEWEAIKKRKDFKEIFPIWFRLGMLLDLPPFPDVRNGMFSLLSDTKKAIEMHRPEMVVPAFNRLFLAGFKHMMVPRLQDEEHLGILPLHSSSEEISPLYLLRQGALLIRSLFLKSEENEVVILPNLPPELFSGKMLHIRCDPYGEVDLEWTKKTIRKLEFRALKEGRLYFHFQSHLKSFRLRLSEKDRGIILNCGSALEIKSGNVYLLDQFQK